MRKTLGDYNIEKSSSSDLNNISWSQKKLNEDKKPRKKKIVKEGQMPSGTNITVSYTHLTLPTTPYV